MLALQFGKGVYFADMCSKSTNYCFASRSKPEGIAVLCDVRSLLHSLSTLAPPPSPPSSVHHKVALGQTNDLLTADYDAAKLPRGKHSTKGLGRVAPDPAQHHTM